MKLIHRFSRSSLNTSGTVCDRCQAVELDPPEPADVLEVSSQEVAVRQPAFVTVGIDHGPEGDYFSGHFCPSCHEVLQSEPGGWMPYLRQIAGIRQGPRYRAFRFPVKDAETGEISWYQSATPQDVY